MRGAWSSYSSTSGEWFSSPAMFAIVQAEKDHVFIPSNHPEPYNDKGIGRCAFLREVCGFPSLNAYRCWFVTPRVRAALYTYDTHHMRVYDVPDEFVITSMIQCLFDPNKATSVRLATPEEYL